MGFIYLGKKNSSTCMINWFKRKQSPLDAIVIPTFQWAASRTEQNMKQWMNPEQTIALSIHFFNLPPDLPSATDPILLRSFFRSQLVPHNGGLITVDILTLKGYTAVKTIFKIPQEPSGMRYLASFIIPFKNTSYVVKIQAIESGYTGFRETMVADSILAKKPLNDDNTFLEGWAQDPYDSTVSSGALMNTAEAEAYDSRFPEHPLSQTRQLMKQIEQQIAFKDDLKNLPPFPR